MDIDLKNKLKRIRDIETRSEDEKVTLEDLRAAEPSGVAALTRKDIETISLLNANLFAQYNFYLDMKPEGLYYCDNRKCPAFRINKGRPFRTVEEALKFVGKSIQILCLQNTEYYKRYRTR